MRFGKSLGVFCAGFLLFLAGCSSSMNTTPPNTMGNVFSLVTDAPPPLPSVVSFQVMITGVTVNNAGGSLSVLSNPATIDFVRLDGLHDLLNLDSVPIGTYTSVTINGSTPVIGYLDTSGGSGVPPVLNTLNATPSTFSVTVPLPSALVVDKNDMVGLLIELDLSQTIQTSGGLVTGTVTPTFDVLGLTADDTEAEIDDFKGGVLSVDSTNNAFSMQGPLGRQWNVTTNSQTNFDDGASFSSIAANDIVEVSGKLDPVTHAIDADEVEVLSSGGFFAGGLATFVSPPSPAAATQLQLYVRAELPNLAPEAPIAQIDSFALNGSENYYIADFHNPLSSLLFGNTTLAPGQRLGLGGTMTTSGGSTTLTVHRVVLQRQGQQGLWVVGSTNVQSGNAGTFQLNDNFLAGVLLPQPVTVMTTNFTNFVNLAGLSALTGAGPIRLRVVGFVLMNQQTNQPVIVARRVEQLNP
jgi:hypothetical protein